MTRRLTVRRESWPIAGTFTIARGSKTSAEVIVAEVEDGAHKGRGECVPYGRYGETLDGVAAALEDCAGDVAAGMSRADLQRRLPAGAARNALDCALWDLNAKRMGTPVAAQTGLPPLTPRDTAFTLSLAAPAAMAAAARAAGQRPLLKLKLGGDAADLDRVRAVAEAAPEARLIVDANESWRPDTLGSWADALAALPVALIEQPLPAGEDSGLERGTLPVPICADESVHDRPGLGALLERYDVVNIKLDKTGGLTEALALAQTVRDAGAGIMIGCMVGTSLAMAPAFHLSPLADFIDLDGPLLLARDRDAAIRYDQRGMHPPDPALWG